jgi:sugar phosphate isomerase/epimerase
MNIALSNLAWDHEDIDKTLTLLKSLNIKHVEGVLTKINPWSSLQETDLQGFKEKLDSYSINCSSLQSLFFGVNAKDMGDIEIITNHIKKLVNYSKLLGVKVLVMGSPILRKKTEDFTWKLKLIDTMKAVDDILKDTGITLVIEPNARIYKGDYFYTCTEIVDFLRIYHFSNIKTMIDTHNLLYEFADPINEYYENIFFISHIHISENNLEPISYNKFHNIFAKELFLSGYDKLITYEVKKSDNVEESIKIFASIYS